MTGTGPALLAAGTLAADAYAGLRAAAPAAVSAAASAQTRGFLSPSGVEIAFLLVGLVTLGAAVVTVTTRQLVHAALWLVVALGGLAVEYLLLTAEFIAWVQVLIYVGSVVVLLLFGLMLTRAPIGRSPDADSGNRPVALAVASVAAVTLVWVVADAFRTTWIDLDGPARGSTEASGRMLFSHWVLPFEALSVLLLAALVGAIVLSRRNGTPATSPAAARTAGLSAPSRGKPSGSSGTSARGRNGDGTSAGPSGSAADGGAGKGSTGNSAAPGSVGNSAGTADAGGAGAGTADTGTADTGTADTGTADTGTADTGTADALLFCTGLYGVLARRNAILVLMSVELMLNAVNLNLVAFDVWLRDTLHAGQALTLFTITIAAAEIGIGLAIVLLVYRNRGSSDIDRLRDTADSGGPDPDTDPDGAAAAAAADGTQQAPEQKAEAAA